MDLLWKLNVQFPELVVKNVRSIILSEDNLKIIFSLGVLWSPLFRISLEHRVRFIRSGAKEECKHAVYSAKATVLETKAVSVLTTAPLPSRQSDSSPACVSVPSAVCHQRPLKSE